MKSKKLLALITAISCSVSVTSITSFMSQNVTACEIVNDSFDVNYDGWIPSTDNAAIEAVAEAGFESSRGMKLSGRISPEDGACSDKSFYLYDGKEYDFSVMVKADAADTFELSLEWTDIDTEEVSSKVIETEKAAAGEWTEITGSFRTPANTGNYVFTLTSRSTQDFYFDEFTVTGKTSASEVSAAVAGKGLKDEFANYFRVGNILNGGTVNNAAITANLVKDCNAIECENETKPDATLNQSGCSGTANIAVSLNSAAKIIDFCIKNNMAFRGHTLVWHSQTPQWFFKENFNANGNWVSTSVMDQRLENYIKAMFNAFKTQYPSLNLYAYDVANECISDDPNRTANNGGARVPGNYEKGDGSSGWVSVYGNNSFVEKAFTYARKYAPEGCKLFYNDYNEYWDHKQTSIINTILKPLKAKGLIDGMGMQSHIDAGYDTFSGTVNYLKAMDTYSNLGLEVHVSELDISVKDGFTSKQQADKYVAIFKHAMEINQKGTGGKVTLLQIWGPNDANSWLPSGSNALLYDSNNKPKEAYTALLNVLPDSQWGDGNNPSTGDDEPAKPNDFGWYFQNGFEGTEDGWAGRGAAAVASSTNEHYTKYGNSSLLVSGREASWNGAYRTLSTKVFQPGETYSFSTHVKYTSGADSVLFQLSLEYVGADGETHYDHIATSSAIPGKWVQLVNTTYTIPEGASDLKLYVETADDSTVDFYMDEVIGAVGGTGIAGEGPMDPGDVPGSAMPGDVNCDGKINALDMAAMRRGLNSGFANVASETAADVNQSGKADSVDSRYLRDFLIGKITEFPVVENVSSVDDAAAKALFSGVKPLESYKKEGENNVLWTQRFGADPGFMVYKDRLYVYTTNDAFEYKNGQMIENTYNVQTINCFSSSDLVNWTDHGAIPVAGKNNGVGAAKWAGYSWAPDAAWKTINGKDKFFLYFADSAGGIGVLTADSPTGPWTDPIGKALINRSTPGYSDVTWLFDPAVLVDDDGTGYLYCGGGVPEGKTADPGTARAVKLGDDMISVAGYPSTINPPYLFEDSSIFKDGDTYYYSYCTNWNTGGNPYGFNNAEIGVMTSKSPLGPFTYKGIALKNPASYQIDGGGNNHHSLLKFKDKYYVLYHSRVIERRMGVNGGNGFNYRSCHIDEATMSNGMITATGTMKGVSQLETLDPYVLNGAETMSSQSKDITVDGLGDTKVTGKKGAWLKVSGVDFSKGAGKLTVKGSSAAGAMIKICTGSPTGNAVGYVKLTSSDSSITVPVSVPAGTKDVYFVLSDTATLDSWQFSSEKVTGIEDVYIPPQ